MADKLISALTEKGKAELYLSNLEKLKEEGSVENMHYEALKAEYTKMLDDAQSKINEEKSQIQKVLDSKKQELAVAKLDLKYLEIRHKVGEMPADVFDKKQREPQKKITELENTIAQLEKTINTVVPAESLKQPLELPKKKLFGLDIGLGKKQEMPQEITKPPVTPKPPEPVQPPTPAAPTIEEIESIPEDIAAPVTEEEVIPPVAEKKPLPPGLQITSLDILPNRVAAGNHVGIVANLKNTSGNPIQHRIDLRINDEIKDYRDVFLPPEQSEEITFMILTNKDGEFDVDVGGQTGKYTVLSSH